MHGYTGTSRDSPRSSQVLGGHADLGLGCMGTVGQVGIVPGHPRYLEDMQTWDSPKSPQVLGGHTDLGLGCMGTQGPVGTVPGHPRYLDDIQTWDLGAWVHWDK